MTTVNNIIAAPISEAPTKCAHCGQTVPRGAIDTTAQLQFCCSGCQTVYETIHACGLDSYYRLREIANDPTIPAAHTTGGKFASFDSEEFHKLYVQNEPGGTQSIDFLLEGISCAACVWLVEKLPNVVEGVVDARLNYRQSTVHVVWDPLRVKLSRVGQILDRFGYTPHAARGQSRRELRLVEERRLVIHIAMAGALMGNIMLLALALYSGWIGGMETKYETFFRWISAGLGTISLAWPGAVFFKSSWAAMRARTINLDVPIALALLVGGVAGLVNVVLNRGDIYFDSLAVLVFLLLVGRYFQHRQHRRADDAVELLFSLTPSECYVVRDGRVDELPVESLVAGDIIEIRPGDLVPADSVVETGRSTVDQSLLTGESAPVEIGPADRIHAGSMNVGSIIRARVEMTGEQTRVGKLMQLVERGIQEKPQAVKLADRIGFWFLPAVVVASAIILIAWAPYGLGKAIDHTVAFLIVTCPCVLGLATPLTIAVAIGRLARQNVLVKGAMVLEKLSRKGTILLDKTGTLTQGRPAVLEWIGDTKIQPIVAEIERNSRHPIGKALCEAYGQIELSAADRAKITDLIDRNDGGLQATVDTQIIRVGSVRYITAQGADTTPWQDHITRLQQMSATVVMVSVDNHVVAAVALRDQVRADSRQAIDRVREMGWQPSILSGDSNSVVQATGIEVGISADHIEAPVFPEEKLARVKSSTQQQTTIMVGDGVNDAAALAAADVGIAVHGGAEASLAAADVYVGRPGLLPVVQLISLSRYVMRVIYRNFSISLGYNLLAGTLAAVGVMHPMIAAIIMPISAATVLATATWSVMRYTGGQQWK